MTITWQAEDTVEPIADTTIEGIANFANYSVVSGCGLTYSGANMTVTVAAGSVRHNGTTVTVAGNNVTLVSDATNPRWTWIGIPSSGTAAVISGTAAATPTVPEIGDYVPIALVYVQANLTVANNASYKLDKRVFYPSAVDVQTFTGNGTWTRPVNYTATSRTLVKVFGAGGGGGGGGSNSGFYVTGGGGGGGGAYSSFEFPTSSLGTTETVTIGSAGTSGAGAGSGGSNGTAGGAGGSTTFGSWLTGYGGGGGGRGQASALSKGATAGGGGGGGSQAGTTGSFYSSATLTSISTAGGNPKTGAWSQDINSFTNYSMVPGDAGGGWSVQRSPTFGNQSTTSVVDQSGNGLNAGWFGGGGGGMCEIADGTAYQGGPSMWGGGGGGGGGGCSNLGAAYAAGKGGEYRKWYSMGTSSSGAAAGSNGSTVAAGGAGTAGTSGATNYTGGGGGGGGGYGSTGGAGGAGGARGGAGGGGGASWNGVAGAGGAGGAGYCEVITYI